MATQKKIKNLLKQIDEINKEIDEVLADKYSTEKDLEVLQWSRRILALRIRRALDK
jgi:peptidoglycan hydrolase CwlO-like protein